MTMTESQSCLTSSLVHDPFFLPDSLPSAFSDLTAGRPFFRGEGVAASVLAGDEVGWFELRFLGVVLFGVRGGGVGE